jgi:hypothetical protein
MITLKLLVDRYNKLASQAGAPVALAAFGLSSAETEKLFSTLDEDYHISRHLRFSKTQGQTFRISGEEVTHVTLDAAIRNLL